LGAGPEVTTFLQTLVPFLVLVALGVAYILVGRRADERRRERGAGFEGPEVGEVRKAA
jgi:hypothetical protein